MAGPCSPDIIHRYCSLAKGLLRALLRCKKPKIIDCNPSQFKLKFTLLPTLNTFLQRLTALIPFQLYTTSIMLQTQMTLPWDQYKVPLTKQYFSRERKRRISLRSHRWDLCRGLCQSRSSGVMLKSMSLETSFHLGEFEINRSIFEIARYLFHSSTKFKSKEDLVKHPRL